MSAARGRSVRAELWLPGHCSSCAQHSQDVAARGRPAGWLQLTTGAIPFAAWEQPPTVAIPHCQPLALAARPCPDCQASAEPALSLNRLVALLHHAIKDEQRAACRSRAVPALAALSGGILKGSGPLSAHQSAGGQCRASAAGPVAGLCLALTRCGQQGQPAAELSRPIRCCYYEGAGNACRLRRGPDGGRICQVSGVQPHSLSLPATYKPSTVQSASHKCCTQVCELTASPLVHRSWTRLVAILLLLPGTAAELCTARRQQPGTHSLAVMSLVSSSTPLSSGASLDTGNSMPSPWHSSWCCLITQLLALPPEPCPDCQPSAAQELERA